MENIFDNVPEEQWAAAEKAIADFAAPMPYAAPTTPRPTAPTTPSPTIPTVPWYELEEEKKAKKKAEEHFKILWADLEVEKKAKTEAEEKAKILEAELEKTKKALKEAEEKARKAEEDAKTSEEISVCALKMYKEYDGRTGDRKKR